MNGGLHFANLFVQGESYHSLQPRFGMNYSLPGGLAFKASYAEMTQNIHLLSNSSIGFPSDIWVPATDTVPSQTSKQWAGNISTEFGNGEYELSLEGYYKTMNNLITVSYTHLTLPTILLV